MTSPETERLIRLEQKQQAMTEHIADLTVSLKENSTMTKAIKTQLDELTGAKKFLMALSGFVLGIATVVAAWISGKHH